MKINEWDVSEAQAKQWNVTPGHASVSNDSTWTQGAAAPILLSNTTGFKTLKVTLLVKGTGREEIMKNRSTILSKCLAPVKIQLDGYSHLFYGVLTKHTPTEYGTKKRFHTLALEFNCYEYEAQADGSQFSGSASGSTDLIINNQGNLVTPATVLITPQVGLASLKLTGLVRNPYTGEDLPVTVKKLTTGKTITIDGETGLMTEDEKLKSGDIETYGLPSLVPGTNTITLDSQFVDITVKYFPRYM